MTKDSINPKVERDLYPLRCASKSRDTLFRLRINSVLVTPDPSEEKNYVVMEQQTVQGGIARVFLCSAMDEPDMENFVRSLAYWGQISFGTRDADWSPTWLMIDEVPAQSVFRGEMWLKVSARYVSDIGEVITAVITALGQKSAREWTAVFEVEGRPGDIKSDIRENLSAINDRSYTKERKGEAPSLVTLKVSVREQDQADVEHILWGSALTCDSKVKRLCGKYEEWDDKREMEFLLRGDSAPSGTRLAVSVTDSTVCREDETCLPCCAQYETAGYRR